MARRRRVGNLLALAVLSALVERPMHPYEMAGVLRARGKDQDMPIKWGSLYTVVANLERHGLLAAVQSDRQGRRPERTVYRITEAGRDELVDWTRELIAVPEREHPRFEAGLSVLGVLGPDEATELLRQRLDRLETQLADARAALARHGREIPRLFLVEAEYDLAVRQAEATWVRGLLDELTTGSLPGLTEWRAWHETGAVPPDWAELAERGTEQQ
ncbi:PadR family transcriptional regulator [Micromonospora sp. PLK6-60]|uniref:PadR family transcriptional regulator n=1 Tax=Micromonospora sp. PLK6-60 TaxID=2873383 RepID=UPI001CA636D2|nr:PadR family transcriptional regulator [Micromonospora sp. PLK6-60]MBY8872949.1 PadR family transcriptional regulator [Micromonospora sp. PLK6-60]